MESKKICALKGVGNGWGDVTIKEEGLEVVKVWVGFGCRVIRVGLDMEGIASEHVSVASWQMGLLLCLCRSCEGT